MDNAAKNSILEPPITSNSIGEGNKENKLGLILAIIVIAVIAILLGYYFIKQTKNPIISTNVAIEVNGQQISKEFFNHRIDIQTNFYKVVSPDSGKLATVAKDETDDIINIVLMEQELRKRNMLPADDEINNRIVEQKNRYEKTATASGSLNYEQLLQNQYKMTLDDKKYIEKKELMAEKISSLRVQKDLWALWLKKAAPSDGNNLATPAQKAKDEKTLALAKDILIQVKSGADLSKLAAQYSQDSVSKAKGGNIGFYPDTNVSHDPLAPAPFVAMAVLDTAYSKLNSGEADVFDYPSGYAIVKVKDTKGDWPYTDLADFLTKVKQSSTIKINVN